MKKLVAALLCVGVALAAAVATAGTTSVVARGMAKGSLAHVSLGASANDAARIELKITGSPNQRISADWSIYCNDSNFDDSGSRSGDFEATTPVTRRIPIPVSDPDECEVSSYVSNVEDDSGGTIRVIITRTRRS
jgi:hypothetical protein